MPHERRDLLNQLVQRLCPVSETITKLSAFEFDSDPIVIISKEDVISALTSYLEGRMTAKDVEEWANAIEVRDDLGYPSSHGEAVKEVIYDLANPLLAGTLTASEAQRMKSYLQA